jgi:radical SAM superfamily enzyme YgiQ (UPF0313 family)
LPEEALRYFDAVCVGEGELAWPEILSDIEQGCLGGVYAPHGREFDLADAPIPRYDLLDPDKYNRLTVQTSRGCPWKCDFCASSILLTSRYKLKPVQKVIDEIRAIKQVWPTPFIEFADDNTFVNKRHSRELVRALIPEQLRWFTETDVSVADDETLLDLMRDAGCQQVLIGFESPIKGMLDGVETKRNWKWQKYDFYRDAIERIQSHGITVNGCFVLGLDGSTGDQFEAIRSFVEEAGLYEVQITVMTVFPGTPLYTRMLREGRLLDESAWEKCTMFDVNVRPNGLSVRELEDGLINLGRQLYSVEARQARINRFKQQLREQLRREREARLTHAGQA